MDKETQKSVFQLASCLLTYPGHESFWQTLDEVGKFAGQLPDMPAVRAILKGIRVLLQSDRDGLERLYCREFDFQESSSLYLTAHELGDSRKRGMAMIELRQLYLKAGFVESESDYLPDYIPRLFEFLAVKPEALDTNELEKRLKVVCTQILEHISTNSPYSFVFYAVLKCLPGEEKDVPEEERFPFFEEADLDELPYPLYYQ